MVAKPVRQFDKDGSKFYTKIVDISAPRSSPLDFRSHDQMFRAIAQKIAPGYLASDMIMHMTHGLLKAEKFLKFYDKNNMCLELELYLADEEGNCISHAEERYCAEHDQETEMLAMADTKGVLMMARLIPYTRRSTPGMQESYDWDAVDELFDVESTPVAINPSRIDEMIESVIDDPNFMNAPKQSIMHAKILKKAIESTVNSLVNRSSIRKSVMKPEHRKIMTYNPKGYLSFNVFDPLPYRLEKAADEFRWIMDHLARKSGDLRSIVSEVYDLLLCGETFELLKKISIKHFHMSSFDDLNEAAAKHREKADKLLGVPKLQFPKTEIREYCFYR